MSKDNGAYIKNIYYMLAYAYESLERPEYKRFEEEEFEDADDLFAALLSSGIGFLMKKGLHRDYVGYREDLPTVRGKIDLPSTIRNKVARKQTISCEFDELSENNYLNQILKTTAMLLIKNPKVTSEWKNLLKTEMHYFANVDALDPKSIRWPKHYRRSSVCYEPSIHVCEMAIKSMLLVAEEGDRNSLGLPEDSVLCHIYEKFILNYYARHRPDLKPSAAKVDWALDDGFDDMLPDMQTDVCLEKGKRILIIDAKYYKDITQVNYGKHSIRSDHLYQILAYVKNRQAANEDFHVSGMLLYAKREEDIEPKTYKIHGNEISVGTLDLNASFRELTQKLDEIAKAYFD